MKQPLNLNNFDLSDKKQLDTVAQTIIDNLKTGMTLQQATGISVSTLEEIYCLAYGYYNVGKYRESVSLFQLLASVSPDTYKYVLGLASSYHQLGLYADAAAGFYIALSIEEENPVAAYYLLDCFNHLQLKEEALDVAEIALELCEKKPDYQELYNRILLIKNSLE